MHFFLTEEREAACLCPLSRSDHHIHPTSILSSLSPYPTIPITTMQTQVGRLNTYHGAKRKLLGNNAGAAPPAWKMNQQAISKRTPPGSKILLSNLPMDVTEHEIDVSSKLTCISRCMRIVTGPCTVLGSIRKDDWTHQESIPLLQPERKLEGDGTSRVPSYGRCTYGAAEV